MKPSPPSASYTRAGRFIAALAVLAALLLVAATTGAGLFGGALRNRCYSAATGVAVHAAGERRRGRGMDASGGGSILFGYHHVKRAMIMRVDALY